MAFPHLLIIQPLAESAQTTQPGNDYVTVLQSILDKHAPKGSKIALRKYVPATHKFKKFGKISRYDYGALRARHTSNFTHYRDAERTGTELQSFIFSEKNETTRNSRFYEGPNRRTSPSNEL